MQYKFEYKNLEEREFLVTVHNDLFLIEEKNITEGNFLIFVDNETLQDILRKENIKDRINTIYNYMDLDNNSIDNLENAIIQYETNLITGGM